MGAKYIEGFVSGHTPVILGEAEDEALLGGSPWKLSDSFLIPSTGPYSP
jgi:hypothetical protein